MFMILWNMWVSFSLTVILKPCYSDTSGFPVFTQKVFIMAGVYQVIGTFSHFNDVVTGTTSSRCTAGIYTSYLQASARSSHTSPSVSSNRTTLGLWAEPNYHTAQSCQVKQSSRQVCCVLETQLAASHHIARSHCLSITLFWDRDCFWVVGPFFSLVASGAHHYLHCGQTSHDF